MSNIQTRIVRILDDTMREWRQTENGAGYNVPPMAAGWLSELAEEIVGAVIEEAATSSLPLGILVDASSPLGEALTRTASGRVPAGELRRPGHADQRQPSEDLGTEALPT